MTDQITAVGFGLTKQDRQFILRILLSIFDLKESAISIHDIKNFDLDVNPKRIYFVFGQAAKKTIGNIKNSNIHYLPDLELLENKKENEDYRKRTAKKLKDIRTSQERIEVSFGKDDIKEIKIKLKDGRVITSDGKEADISRTELLDFLNLLAKIPATEIDIEFYPNSDTGGKST